MYFTLWAPAVDAKRVVIPLHVTKTLTGYRSNYYFAADAAEAFKDSRNESSLKLYPCGTDRLLLDFDNGAESAEPTLELLKTHGIGFTVWDSGNKGVHIEIATVPMWGLNVPDQQRAFVERLKLPVDLSLFRVNSLVSLPGNPHRQTGRKKTAVGYHEGERLEIVEHVTPKIHIQDIDLSDGEALRIVLWKLQQLLRDPPVPGQRHSTFFATGLLLKNSGFTFEGAYECLSLINQHSPFPHSDSALQRALKQAWQHKKN